MKKVICILIVILTLTAAALADQAVTLPGGFALDVPDNMNYDAEKGTDSDFCFAYVSSQLEMDVFSYPGSGELRDMVEMLNEQGENAELRKINGIEAICFRGSDPADGTPFIGYLMKGGDQLTEVVFWYATQEAGDRTRTIMETLR